MKTGLVPSDIGKKLHNSACSSNSLQNIAGCLCISFVDFSETTRYRISKKKYDAKVHRLSASWRCRLSESMKAMTCVLSQSHLDIFILKYPESSHIDDGYNIILTDAPNVLGGRFRRNCALTTPELPAAVCEYKSSQNVLHTRPLTMWPRNFPPDHPKFRASNLARRSIDVCDLFTQIKAV